MSDKGGRAAVQNPYAKPTLTKGPLLSRTTATLSPSTVVNSDIRLKRDIHAIDRLANGLTLYRFRYLWSDVEMVGVMAQEVLDVVPEAVVQSEDGYYRVDYGHLGLRPMTYAEWCGAPALADAA